MANLSPILLNGVYSTVQAGSTAIGSASATGVNVATGDGAKFGTLATNQYIPAVIVDTSTSPETIKEYVYVTAVSTDTLTVVRQAEETSRFAASTTTIQAGYTIAAVGSRLTLELMADLRARYAKPTSALVETYPRKDISTSATVVSGRLVLAAIVLPAGLLVSNISFYNNSAMGTPTHWWFGLYDNALAQLAVTADQTTTAWPSATLQTLPVATIASGAASSFTTTYTGLYYIGQMQAATTPATINAVTVSGAGQALTPLLCGNSDSTQTTPPAFPHTAANIVSQSVYLWGYVS